MSVPAYDGVARSKSPESSSPGEAFDRPVCVRESPTGIGWVDRNPVVGESEPLGNAPGRHVLLRDPGDYRNGVVELGCEHPGLSCEFSRVAPALLRSGNAVVEVPGTGSLTLSATHPDDRAVITSADGPVAQSVSFEARPGPRQPITCLTRLTVTSRRVIPPTLRVTEDGEQRSEIPNGIGASQIQTLRDDMLQVHGRGTLASSFHSNSRSSGRPPQAPATVTISSSRGGAYPGGTRLLSEAVIQPLAGCLGSLERRRASVDVAGLN